MEFVRGFDFSPNPDPFEFLALEVVGDLLATFHSVIHVFLLFGAY